jgi:hypothetical protein
MTDIYQVDALQGSAFQSNAFQSVRKFGISEINSLTREELTVEDLLVQKNVFEIRTGITPTPSLQKGSQILETRSAATPIPYVLNKFNIGDSRSRSESVALKSLFGISDSRARSELISLINEFSLFDFKNSSDSSLIKRISTISDSNSRNEAVSLVNRLNQTDARTISDSAQMKYLMSPLADIRTTSDISLLKVLSKVSDLRNWTEAVSLKNKLSMYDDGEGTDLITFLKMVLELSDNRVSTNIISSFKNMFKLDDTSHTLDYSQMKYLMNPVSDVRISSNPIFIQNRFSINDSKTATTPIPNVRNMFSLTDTKTASDASFVKNIFNISDVRITINPVTLLNKFSTDDSGMSTESWSIKNIFELSDVRITTDIGQMTYLMDKISDQRISTDNSTIQSMFLLTEDKNISDTASTKNIFNILDYDEILDMLSIKKEAELFLLDKRDTIHNVFHENMFIIPDNRIAFDKEEMKYLMNPIIDIQTFTETPILLNLFGLEDNRTVADEVNMGQGETLISDQGTSFVHTITKNIFGLLDSRIAFEERNIRNNFTISEKYDMSDFSQMKHLMNPINDSRTVNELHSILNSFDLVDDKTVDENLSILNRFVLSDSKIAVTSVRPISSTFLLEDSRLWLESLLLANKFNISDVRVTSDFAQMKLMDIITDNRTVLDTPYILNSFGLFDNRMIQDSSRIWSKFNLSDIGSSTELFNIFTGVIVAEKRNTIDFPQILNIFKIIDSGDWGDTTNIKNILRILDAQIGFENVQMKYLMNPIFDNIISLNIPYIKAGFDILDYGISSDIFNLSNLFILGDSGTVTEKEKIFTSSNIIDYVNDIGSISILNHISSNDFNIVSDPLEILNIFKLSEIKTSIHQPLVKNIFSISETDIFADYINRKSSLNLYDNGLILELLDTFNTFTVTDIRTTHNNIFNQNYSKVIDESILTDTIIIGIDQTILDQQFTTTDLNILTIFSLSEIKIPNQPIDILARFNIFDYEKSLNRIGFPDRFTIDDIRFPVTESILSIVNKYIKDEGFDIESITWNKTIPLLDLIKINELMSIYVPNILIQDYIDIYDIVKIYWIQFFTVIMETQLSLDTWILNHREKNVVVETINFINGTIITELIATEPFMINLNKVGMVKIAKIVNSLVIGNKSITMKIKNKIKKPFKTITTKGYGEKE